MLGPQEVEEWSNLQELIGTVNMTSDEDEIAWGLSSSRSFTTSSLLWGNR
jgi:hypothetical protein